MRLPRPFFRLPLRFDATRLQQEVAALAEDAWVEHPNRIDGNSSVRLITAGGAETDAVSAPMLATPHLARLPYVRQVLAGFGVVWSRSRLMRLAPLAGVPPHADINHHWFTRVRLHVPILTSPEVTFVCGDERVHMAAGEAWIFDNWRPHRVENPVPRPRVHLVADTSGDSRFWQLVAQSAMAQSANAPMAPRQIDFEPGRELPLLTELQPPLRVMPPAELDLLLRDLRAELRDPEAPGGSSRLFACQRLLEDFAFDWRQLHALHGQERAGDRAYATLREHLRAAAARIGSGLVMSTNGTAAGRVLEARVLQHLLRDDAAPSSAPDARAQPAALQRPTFIVAAPRSGSTLLFETLATHGGLGTLGGEAHWLVEQIDSLRPGTPGVDSNRLTAEQATPAVSQRIRASVLERLAPPPAGEGITRLLEKTPKNALRVPFFDRIFPDARFVFLWRDPRENIASIISAWHAGRWITYPQLPDWDGPWSLLLPPHWQALRGAPLADVAAWQWSETNRLLCEDLAALDPARWISLTYADLIAQPAACLRRVCAFLDLDPADPTMGRRLAAPLPLSRFTQTPPAPDKWRAHESEIERVLPRVEATWQRLRALQAQSASRYP